MARLPSVLTMFVIDLREAKVSPAAKLVGHTLATYMRPDGCAWPSLATLAAGCNLSTRQVRRALRELENAELIDSVSRVGRPSTYLATPDTHVRPEQPFGGTPTSSPPDTHVRGVRTPVSAELVSELVSEQERARDNGDEPVGYGDPGAAERARAAAREARARLGARRAGDDG